MENEASAPPVDKTLRLIAESIIGGEFQTVTVGIQFTNGTTMTYNNGNPHVARGLSESLYDEACEQIEKHRNRED